jgi:hypothetical protein
LYFHGCPDGITCKLIDEPRHHHCFTHPCLNPNCADTEPLHLLKFDHKKETMVDKSVKPLCAYASNCKKRDDDAHKDKYMHYCDFKNDCRKQTNLLHCSRFIHPCLKPNCSDMTPLHLSRFDHPNSKKVKLDEDIDDEEQKTEIKREKPTEKPSSGLKGMCPKGSKCTDPEKQHRISFSHPCRDGKKCTKQTDKEHSLRYNHPCTHGIGCRKLQELNLFHMMKFTHKEDDRGEDGLDFPSEWEGRPTFSDTHSKQVTLSSKSKEYQTVETHFKKSISFYHKNPTIVSIVRKEDGHLWSKYATRKKSILNRLGKKLVNEKMLYHGASEDTINIILKNGFDYRVSDMSKAKYGAGIYFALNASKSDHFAIQDSKKHQRMFLSRVTLGDTEIVTQPCIGKRKPSNKPNSKELFDSHSVISDPNGKTPTEFVIFANDQCYPEYLITYTV